MPFGDEQPRFLREHDCVGMFDESRVPLNSVDITMDDDAKQRFRTAREVRLSRIASVICGFVGLSACAIMQYFAQASSWTRDMYDQCKAEDSAEDWPLIRCLSSLLIYQPTQDVFSKYVITSLLSAYAVIALFVNVETGRMRAMGALGWNVISNFLILLGLGFGFPAFFLPAFWLSSPLALRPDDPSNASQHCSPKLSRSLIVSRVPDSREQLVAHSLHVCPYRVILSLLHSLLFIVGPTYVILFAPERSLFYDVCCLVLLVCCLFPPLLLWVGRSLSWSPRTAACCVRHVSDHDTREHGALHNGRDVYLRALALLSLNALAILVLSLVTLFSDDFSSTVADIFTSSSPLSVASRVYLADYLAVVLASFLFAVFDSAIRIPVRSLSRRLLEAALLFLAMFACLPLTLALYLALREYDLLHLSEWNSTFHSSPSA